MSAYHFCFWTTTDQPIPRVTVLPLGISYAEAQQIVRDQATVHPPTPEATDWTLGTIKVYSEALDVLKNATPLWRWHVPADPPS